MCEVLDRHAVYESMRHWSPIKIRWQDVLTLPSTYLVVACQGCLNVSYTSSHAACR